MSFEYEFPYEHTIEQLQYFIEIAREITPKLAPQYSQAAKEIVKITDLILKENDTILDWISRYQKLSLPETNRAQVIDFCTSFHKFINGPDYGKIKLHCTQVDAIYRTNLKKPLGKLFDRKKLEQIETAFLSFKSIEGADDRLQDRIFEYMAETIPAYTPNDNDVPERIFDAEFVDMTNSALKELRKISNKLRNLRNKILEILGEPIN